MSLYDAHVHLDYMSNAREVALEARERGIRLFANTVTPQGYVRTSKLLSDLENVDVGLGLHPWWVRQASLDEFLLRLPSTRWVGEVGLDFSPKRAHHDLQREVFERIAGSCADLGNKTLSIHSVRSASSVLDILERTGCLDTCTCIFHWFSGSTDDLWRAIHDGCWFSVNEMQAKTRRAKEQLKLIPNERLLFETDYPPAEDMRFSAECIESSLIKAMELTAQIRKGQTPHR